MIRIFGKPFSVPEPDKRITAYGYKITGELSCKLTIVVDNHSAKITDIFIEPRDLSERAAMSLCAPTRRPRARVFPPACKDILNFPVDKRHSLKVSEV